MKRYYVAHFVEHLSERVEDGEISFKEADEKFGFYFDEEELAEVWKKGGDISEEEGVMGVGKTKEEAALNFVEGLKKVMG